MQGAVGLVVAAVIAAAIVANLLSTRPAPALPTESCIVRVYDGDTLRVADGGREYKVRLIGVDTPEAYPSDKLRRDAQRTKQDEESIIVLGRRATAFTKKLCLGRPCRLEYDPANTNHKHRDRFDRVLAFVTVLGKGGGEVSVNAEIIRAGYGMALTRYPFDEQKKRLFQRLQREARAAKRGLWGEWKP